MSKRGKNMNNENLNNNSNNIEDIININLNEYKDIKMPLSLKKAILNLNEANLILDEISNLDYVYDKFFLNKLGLLPFLLRVL